MSLDHRSLQRYLSTSVAGWNYSLCRFSPQTLPVQARLWFIGSTVRGGAGLPPDLWDSVLPSTPAPPSQQRDQTTVYLQQASPLLQLEVYGPVSVTPHSHPGPAAHIRHRWVTIIKCARLSCVAARENFVCSEFIYRINIFKMLDKQGNWETAKLKKTESIKKYRNKLFYT